MPTHPTIATLLAEHAEAPTDLAKALAVGCGYWARCEFSRAQAHLETVAEAFPEAAEPWRLSGEVLTEAGRESEAISCFARALALDPADAYSFTGAGQLALQQGRYEEAERFYRQLAALRPMDLEPYRGLARIALETGTTAARIAADAPRGPFASGLGRALFDLGRYEEARAVLREQVAREPEDWPAVLNLARCEEFLGEYGAARALFGRGMTSARPLPELARAFVEFLVRMGDLGGAAGLYRMLLGHMPAAEAWPPDWRGEPVAGKTVVLTNAGGLGDTIQFVRFARLLREAGARTIVECQPQLVELLGSFAWADEVVVPYSDHAPADYSTPAQFLPLLLEWDWTMLERDVPFLRAQPERVEACLAQHPAGAALRVGVAWKGSPLWRSDPGRRRSIPLAELAPLAAVPGVELFSLQYGAGTEEMATAGFSIAQMDAKGFPATAAAIATLDVVVAIDSAVAHLAGAMGKPCFLLLPKTADWRWMTDERECAYYRSVRLFRQTRAADWAGPVRDVASAVAEMAMSRRPLAASVSNRV